MFASNIDSGFGNSFPCKKKEKTHDNVCKIYSSVAWYIIVVESVLHSVCFVCTESELLDVIGTKVSLKSFPPCYSQSPLITDFTPPPPSNSGLKLVCNVNIVYGNLKSQNHHAQKP
jgi:hypothetical protein